jgi:hypothetical protein
VTQLNEKSPKISDRRLDALDDQLLGQVELLHVQHAMEEGDVARSDAVGRCENSDAVYNEDQTRLLKAGHHPVLIEAIEATIHLRTARPNLKVLLISEHGELVIKLPTRYEDGVLTFDIGPQPDWIPSTMYYLIRV